MTEQVRILPSRTFIRELVEQAILELIMAPTKRALILIQTQEASNPNLPKTQRIRGLLSAITQIIKREGFMSLWRGNLIETIKNCIFKASDLLFLQLYEYIFISGNTERSGFGATIREFLLLFACELSTLLVCYPLKVIRVRLSGFEDPNKPKKSGFRRITDCIQEIRRKDGIAGFYRGFSVAFLQSLNVMALTAARRPLINWLYPDPEELKSQRSLLKDLVTVGSPAGVAKTYLSQSKTILRIKNNAWKELFKVVYHAFSTIWLYPFGLVQARVIVRDDHDPKKIFEGPLKVVKEIWDREGLDGFYRGVMANLTISLVAYLMQSTAKSLAEESMGGPDLEEEGQGVVEDEDATFLEMKRRERTQKLKSNKLGQRKAQKKEEKIEKSDDYEEDQRLEAL